MHPDDKLMDHLYRSMDSMFGTNACDGQLPLNLRHYPRSDAQIQAEQEGWERLQDRYTERSLDELYADEVSMPLYGDL
jgi:hypothetical protein